MAGRIRSIKPEILEDERSAGLSSDAWRLWVSMWLLADDHGRLRGSPVWLEKQIFWAVNPRDDLARLLEELANARVILQYDVDGQRYIEIRNWTKHQKVDKPSRPRIPSPPTVDASVPANTRETLAKPRETIDTDLRSGSPITDPDPFPSGESPSAPPDQSSFKLAPLEQETSKKISAPDVAEAVTHFQRRWVEVRKPDDGVPPTLTKADRGQLVAMLKLYGLDGWKKHLERYLVDGADKVIAANGWPLRLMSQRVDGYRITATPTSRTGPLPPMPAATESTTVTF